MAKLKKQQGTRVWSTEQDRQAEVASRAAMSDEALAAGGLDLEVISAYQAAAARAERLPAELTFAELRRIVDECSCAFEGCTVMSCESEACPRHTARLELLRLAALEADELVDDLEVVDSL